MPAQVTVNGPCSRTIKIEITPDTIRESLADAWRNAATNVQMKGFRPGKVPRHILEKKYGEQLRLEVKQHLLEDAWKSAIRDHKLRPVEYHCPYDAGKVKDMLRSLGRAEVEAILADKGEIVIRNEMCNHDYRFDAGILAELFDDPA